MAAEEVVTVRPRPDAAPRGEAGGLTRARKRAVRACLPFNFRESDSGWSWLSGHANMVATVSAGDEKNALVVSVLDAETGERIELWTAVIRLTGAWRRRVRQLSGEAMILAQSRPRCPKCGTPARLRRARAEGNQFFGCPKFPKCNGLLNVVEFDVEHV